MPQFLIGFWCGFVAASLVLCLLYANKRRQAEEGTGNTKKSTEKDGVECNTEGVSPGFKVLLTDDSRLSRNVIKEFLSGRNWEILEAGDGPECLRLAQKNTFDLVFLDQNMPGPDGDEILYRLWKEGGLDKSVPVIAVGSSVRKENEAEFKEKGYAACLGKPIQKNRLDEILTRVIPDTGGLREPDGFSYAKGLKNFDGNDAAYRETLVLFAELWEERREQLRQFLDEENMEEYAILIHAVKGDARTLGAEGLGESAYEQELKAKQGDVRAIRNSFERVIKEGDVNAEFFRTMFS